MVEQRGGKVAGFFDVDGTLGTSNVVSAYVAFRLHGASRLRRLVGSALFLPRVPFYAALDTISREWFCRVFYHIYADVPEDDLELWGEEAAQSYWTPRLFPGALRQIEEHRAQGHLIVLLTGGIEPVLKPLARMLAPHALVAAQPETQNGVLTGRLIDGPLTGDRKADAAHEIAARLGVDMERSYAYADSYADREILECVGNPVAVNPDRRLLRAARSGGWQIRRWGRGRDR